MSHNPAAMIVFEPRPSGRIYERTPDGQELEWGEVTVWEPPDRLGYRWHIATQPERATDVEIRFVATAVGATEVRIVHSGWEQLGDDGPVWRHANMGGWNGVLPDYSEACRTG